MNKKFLSAILFGALMVTSTGTFVSCKDYDDDIDSINKELADIKSQIAALQSKVDAGNYVTGVTKTTDGITFAFSNGSPVTVEIKDGKDGAQGEAGKDGKDGSIVEVKDGVLYIDGEATEFTVPEEAPVTEFKPAVAIVDGEWAVLNEEGEYETTGVAVSSVAVAGDEKNGYVLTVKDAEGEATVIELPTAASLITSITVAPTQAQDNPKADFAIFDLAKAKFVYNNNKKDGYNTWGGEKELPTNNSIVYSPTTSLNVRINPIEIPANDVTFYLTNTKNQTLSQIALSASTTQQSWNGPITIGGINGRSVTNNGLWTLGMSQYILDKDAATAFDKELKNKGAVNLYNVPSPSVDDYVGAAAFAVNANDKARSEYGVAVSTSHAGSLTKIAVNSRTNWVDELDKNQPTPITVNVGQTYKIVEGVGQAGLMYDMYFTAPSETVVETYGLVLDDLNRTFTVTKRPDVVTAAKAFTLTIHTLDIWGAIRVGEYKVSLSAKIEDATATYPEVVYDLSRFNNNNDDDDSFSLAISTMKNALGDKWSTWANSVNLAKTTVEVYKDASLRTKVDNVTASTTSGLTYGLYTSNGNTTTDVNTLNNVRINVASATTYTYTVDTQYYIKVTFNNKSSEYVNHIVVPVMFTAPTVADQFALKSGYVVDGTVNAFYYNYESVALADRKSVALKHYFDAYDDAATMTLDTDAAVVSASNGETWSSNALAALTTSLTETAMLSLNASAIGKWGTVWSQDATTRTEAGYGKNLTIEAWNETYDGWKYKTDAQKAYSFTIKLMSPIFEGTIKPVSGSTINVTANAETGFAITKSMIELADYNKNLYSVVPDKNGVTPDNTGTDGKDAWTAAQINDVWVTKDANNTYIKNFSMQEYKENTDGEVIQEGAIVVYADPLPNTQATSMTVNVKDCWGYYKAQEVSVTIVKK